MSDPTFQIPKEIINPIIQAHVNDAVIKALDGPGQIVTRAIAGVLQTKVDSNGKPSSYNSDRDRTWIDWVIGDCIQKAARDAIEQTLSKHTDRIREEITAQLAKKNSPLVKQLIEGMVGAFTSDHTIKYRINVSHER